MTDALFDVVGAIVAVGLGMVVIALMCAVVLFSATVVRDLWHDLMHHDRGGGHL